MLCPIITDGPPQPSTKREAKEFQDAQVCLKPAGISFFLDAVPNIFFHVFSDGFFVSMMVFRCFPVDGHGAGKPTFTQHPMQGAPP